MTVISNGKKHIVKKMSPTGKVVLAWKPKAYPKTPQQKEIAAIARECGIKRGISKSELQNAMQCVKEKWA